MIWHFRMKFLNDFQYKSHENLFAESVCDARTEKKTSLRGERYRQAINACAWN
jgi:hypothetical protein